MTLQESECIGYDMSIEDFLESLIPGVPKSIPDLSETLAASANTKDAYETDNSVDSDTFLNTLDTNLERKLDLNVINISGIPCLNNVHNNIDNNNIDTSRHYVRINSWSSGSSGVNSPPLSPLCQINITQEPHLHVIQPQSPTSSTSLSPTPSMTSFSTIVDSPQQNEEFDFNANTMVPWDMQKANDRNYRYDPKPLMRKNKRQLVPNEEKNHKYWQRRQRNNKAARKSREDRRKKELEVLQTMNFLQEENRKLKMYMDNVVKVNEQMQGDVLRMRQQLEQAGFFLPPQTRY